MPRIRPFTGLLYDTAVAGGLERLTTPPYDSITPSERERYHATSPFNVVRLIRSRGTRGEGRSVDRYTRAANYLGQWRVSGVLVPTAEPAVYPYEFVFRYAGRVRTLRGVIAEVALETSGGSIIPHERTLPGPIQDRLAVLKAVRANLSPVYGVYRGPSASLARYLDEVGATPPDREVTDEEGTRHRMWVRPDGAAVAAEALRDESVMIADGHHRYAVALAHRVEMNERAGPGPWDWLMMLLIDAGAEEPPVLPIHRVIRRAPRGTSPGSVTALVPAPGWAMDTVRDLAEILATVRDEDLTYGFVGLERDRLVHRVGRLHGEPPTVRALHEQVLGYGRTGRLRFVPDAAVAEDLVRSGRGAAAYLLPPTRVDRVRDVIRSGARLPQKSTYFWPKPRTGMVLRPFDP